MNFIGPWGNLITAILYITVIIVLISLQTDLHKNYNYLDFNTLSFCWFIFVAFGFGIIYFWEEQNGKYVGYLLAAALLGKYLVPLFCNFTKVNYWKYMLGVIFSILLSPIYINLFTIYSIANLNQISWENEEVSLVKDTYTQGKLDLLRARLVVLWLLVNAIFGYIIIYIPRDNQTYFILQYKN